MAKQDSTRWEKLASLLKQRVTGEVRFDAYSRMLYSTDASIYQIEPIGVVIPKSGDDVQATIQIAAEERVPILPRGGGTSLSGQAIGPAVVIDFSKYLNHIISIDPERRRVRVQPGVVLDLLNTTLAPYGLQFGPDVATSNRANIGGMIGNNSAGARSILYGKTVDHVLELEVLLADGTRVRLEPLSYKQWQERSSRPGLEGPAYRTVDRIVRQHAEQIRRRFPNILRRVGGYNLDEFLIGPEGPDSCKSSPAAPLGRAMHDGSERPMNLARLIVGSEGTLATVTQAVLGLVPLPKTRGLVLVNFDRMGDALEALADILACGPSAVELLDRMILELAAQNLELAREMHFVRGRPEAILMVEFSSDSQAELAERADELEARLDRRPAAGQRVRALEPPLRDAIWKVRKGGAGLLMGMPGARKPISFVEDTAVSPDRLPEFVRRFQAILTQHDTVGSFYGHASVGCLHIRPLLDLKSRPDVEHMRQIAEEVADLVAEFGGAMSGEHGDGLARSIWNEKMFGPELYQAFRDVKSALDPNGIMNPGKIVDAPDMVENLRYRENDSASEPETLFDYAREGGIAAAVEMCNGAGACRKLHSGTMCPSFRATREEEHTTRGRANALRAAIAGALPGNGLTDPRLYDVLDLCLMCKGCKAECPSNVDLAKLKADFLHRFYQHHGVPFGSRLMGHIRRLNQLGSALPSLTNALLRSAAVKWLLERLGGIDHRRTLPAIARQSFQRWFRRHEPPPDAGSTGRVVLFDDCFTSYHEPQVAQAAVRLLEAAGYAVELAGVGCCGRALISKGLLPEAQRLAQQNVAALAERVGAERPLLGCEPSCLLTFADEYRDFRLGPAAERVAQAADLVDGYLADVVQAGRHQLRFRPRPETALVHGHCHQKALVGTAGTRRALELIPGLELKLLDVGCCGMAGSFGYEREHYEISCKIAEGGLLAACREEPEALVIAPGFSCRSQVHDLAGRQALHPLELLAEQLELG